MSPKQRGSTFAWLVIGATTSALSLACSGGLEGASSSDENGGQTAQAGTNGEGGNAGVGTAGTGGTAAGGTAPLPELPPEPGVEPGSKVAHRLNDAEYNYTLQDLFGDPTLDIAQGWLPGEAGGFDNIASQLHMNDATYEKYFGAAATVAESVLSRADQLAAIVTCQDATPACAQSIIEATGLRVWRRPLQADEVTNLLGVYNTATGAGEDHLGAIKLVLRAMLASPQFLYRMEFDADPATTVKHEVDGYEMASRLSYFLWSSTPDDTLLAEAGAGTLLDPTQLSTTVDRMLGDAKVNRMVRNFSGQWLHIRKVPGHIAFPAQFPSWSPDLAASMAEEAYLYFAQFVQGSVPWSEFVRADMNFVDQRLAAFYGMPDPGGAGFSPVTVTTDQRQGFLSLGAFLAASSFPQRTSPTLRAKAILEDLLCTPPPEPPPNVKAQVDAMQAEAEANMGDEVTDIRAFLDAHRTQPDCAACHAIFDPYGMALENFDGIGQWRTQYPNGAPIDPTATLTSGAQLDGLASVVDQVSANPKLSKCVAEKMFVYGLGRTLEATDRPYIDTAVYNWLVEGTDPTLRGLIKATIETEPFRMRRAAVSN